MKLKKPESLQDIITTRMRWPCVEPVQRIKDTFHVPRGQRHLPVSPRHVSHLYPIKGGIRFTDLMVRNITSNNHLLRELTKKKP